MSPAKLVATGATELRSVFSADQLPGILVAYMSGINAAFAVAIGMVGISLVASLFSKWRRLDIHNLPGAAA